MICLLGILTSCEYEKIPSLQTDYVKSVYTNSTTVTLNSAVWAKTPEFIIPLVDILSNQVNVNDSILNENGGYKGLNSFNKGNAITLKIKSVYSSDKIYILAEWQDSSLNPTNKIWKWNGAGDIIKNQSAPNWTMQNSDDKLVLKFDFTTGNEFTKDIWVWSSALSDPLGYAIDMAQKSDNIVINDNGTLMYARNGTSFKSGPIYELNGIQQVIKPDGSKAVLDPLYYLFNKTEFKGNAFFGETSYQLCAGCHSLKPQIIGMSHQAVKDFLVSEEHPGKDDVNSASNADVENAIAYYRGKYGIPGYFLQMPSGSVADVWASSNVIAGKINSVNKSGYKVLFIRNLNTSNKDDVVFDTKDGNEYRISFYMYNADSVNYIGIENQKMIFKKSWDEN